MPSQFLTARYLRTNLRQAGQQALGAGRHASPLCASTHTLCRNATRAQALAHTHQPHCSPSRQSTHLPAPQAWPPHTSEAASTCSLRCGLSPVTSAQLLGAAAPRNTVASALTPLPSATPAASFSNLSWYAYALSAAAGREGSEGVAPGGRAAVRRRASWAGCRRRGHSAVICVVHPPFRFDVRTRLARG